MWGLPGESLVRHTEGGSGAMAHGYCHLSPGSPDCHKATTNSTLHNQGPPSASLTPGTAAYA